MLLQPYNEIELKYSLQWVKLEYYCCILYSKLVSTWFHFCGSLITSGQLLQALSRLPQGKAFHFFVPFCRLLQSAGNTGGPILLKERKPLPGILPNQGSVLHTPKALPTSTYRMGEIIYFSPPIRVLPLLSREGDI